MDILDRVLTILATLALLGMIASNMVKISALEDSRAMMMEVLICQEGGQGDCLVPVE